MQQSRRRGGASARQGICKAIGATSCTIVDGPAGTGPSTAANKVPVVSFDQVETHCVGGTTTLSADIAFGPDSSKVKKAVDKILKAGRTVAAEGEDQDVESSAA